MMIVVVIIVVSIVSVSICSVMSASGSMTVRRSSTEISHVGFGLKCSSGNRANSEHSH